jgi:hypothetical protein
MIDPSDFGHELVDSHATTIRESRTKLNVEKADVTAQIKGGHANKQEGLLTLIEMDLRSFQRHHAPSGSSNASSSTASKQFISAAH